jgi:hypothetical protein
VKGFLKTFALITKVLDENDVDKSPIGDGSYITESWYLFGILPIYKSYTWKGLGK